LYRIAEPTHTPSDTSLLTNVIEPIGATTPTSLSLESKMLGAPFAPSRAEQIATLIDLIYDAGRKRGTATATGIA